jgi:uncharacterized paraquat-inducible protein A
VTVNKCFCPVCLHRIKLSGRLRRGQQVKCNTCRAGLVITAIDPIELELQPKGAGPTKVKPIRDTIEVPCPSCDEFVELSSPLIKGQRAVCEACHADLVVVCVDPVELDLPLTISFRGQRRGVAG